MLASARGLDGGIERQQVGLLAQIVDQHQDPTDLADLVTERR